MSERSAERPASGAVPATDIRGCEALRAALAGTEIVVLTAPAAEAAPLLGVLEEQRHHVVATKTVVTGNLCLLSGLVSEEPDSVVASTQPAAARASSRRAPRTAVAVSGCDKANTAHLLTCLLQALDPPPALVVQVGIAGAFVRPEGDGPKPGDVVVATEEVYGDTGSSSPTGWLSTAQLGLPMASPAGVEMGNVFPLDGRRVEAAVAALKGFPGVSAGEEGVAGTDPAAQGETARNSGGPRVFAGRCLTCSQVTGRAAEASELVQRWGALAESMEGAAAAHMCALYGVPFLEVRGISNLITDRNRDSWEVPRAIEAAGRAALHICAAFAKEPDVPLSLAISPCPNDVFVFRGWMEGLVEGAPAVQVRLEDIDTLNQLADAGEADVVKVSMHAFAYLRDRYTLLHSGGALGRGCGPLVVARKDGGLRPLEAGGREATLADQLSRVKVAVPGGRTTAALLLELFTGGAGKRVIMPFDRIMPAVAAGEVDAGVIIHEGRFTYGAWGLRRLVDLGEWWETTTSLPLPLGGIAVRRSLSRHTKAAVERAVRESLELAWRRRAETVAYARGYAQEMDEQVCSSHVDLYVNEFTRDYGEEGTRAIRHLLESAAASRVGKAMDVGVFWDED